MGNLSPQLNHDLIQLNEIPAELYQKFDVKRGLRNPDGSGVLAGLTRIASVSGTVTENGKVGPAPGKLAYRGMSIYDIVDRWQSDPDFGFERATHLLLCGQWPDDAQFAWIQAEMQQHRNLSDRLLNGVILGLPSPDLMNTLLLGYAALYAEDKNPDDLDIIENIKKSLILIAKSPLLVAASYLANIGRPIHFPDTTRSVADHFLTMMRPDQPVTTIEKSIFDLCLVLHTEHGGGNNSTFATRVVTSSGTDIYSSLSAALASLKGPLHGAANVKVTGMMEAVKSNVKNWKNDSEVADYIRQLLTKQAFDRSGKLYGLGHAVYTESDPRAIILKEKALQLAKEKNREDELNLYLTIARLGPELFAEIKGDQKRIAPNVDFFSGFVYQCLGLPISAFTAIFAMARTSGWCAHRIEELGSGKRIIRPAYKFVGQ